MKQCLKLIPILALCLLVFSCGDDEESYKTVERPEWNIDTTGKYPLSMTAIVSIPEDLKSYESDNDIVAAFINDECRGIGSLKKNGDLRVYFIMIKGTDSEQSKVSFRYYCSKTSCLYITDDSLIFKVDKTYGSADNPVSLTLQHIPH